MQRLTNEYAVEFVVHAAIYSSIYNYDYWHYFTIFVVICCVSRFFFLLFLCRLYALSHSKSIHNRFINATFVNNLAEKLHFTRTCSSIAINYTLHSFVYWIIQNKHTKKSIGCFVQCAFSRCCILQISTCSDMEKNNNNTTTSTNIYTNSFSAMNR